MDKNSFPEHWQFERLSDISDLQSGKRPTGSTEDYASDIPSLGGGELDAYGGFKLSGEIPMIPREFYEEDMRTGKIQEKDILIVKDGATTGKTSFVDHDFPYNDAAINSHLYILRGDDNISQKYLFYFVYSHLGQRQIKQSIKGAAQGGINMSFADDFYIPIPPLNEQRAIVEKIDFLFVKINESREAQRKSKEIGGNLLFSLFLELVDNADTEETKTGEVIRDSQYGISQAMNSEEFGYPILRMGNYDSKGNMDYFDLKHIELSDKEFEKYKLEEGDVLFNRTNSKELVGKTAIFGGELNNAVFASYLIRVYLDETKVLPEYFINYLNSSRGRAEIDKLSKQAVSQANINSTELREMRFELPSLKEQQRIINRLQSMREQVQEISGALERGEKLLADLPKSIFDMAFRGQLVDFDTGETAHPKPIDQATIEDF